MAMIYHFTARPSRITEAMPIDFYSEDEKHVRDRITFWENAGWSVKVTYGLVNWVNFDPTYVFTNVTGEEYT